MAESLGLLKFTQRQHAEAFVNEGEMLFRPLEHFRALEGDELRGDPDEGLGAYHQVPLIEKITFKPVGSSKTAEFSTKAGTLLAGKFRIFEHTGEHVFCCYAVAPRNPSSVYVDPRNFEFAPYCVAIYDAKTFFDKLDDAIIATGFAMKRDFVEYVDPQIHSGTMGPFRKFRLFEFQSEYRVAVKTGLQGPWKLKIGSLRSIADVAPVSGINASLTINYNLLPGRGETSAA